MTSSRYFVVGVAAGALAVLLLVIANKALAQNNMCGPEADVTDAILNVGEKLAVDAQAKTPQGFVKLRIFAHPKTGTWTVITLPSPGVACISSIGEGWSPARLPGIES